MTDTTRRLGDTPDATRAATAGSGFDRLVEIMRALRAPDGCPWDREQTLASLRPFVLEETYEVLDAIEHGPPDHLREELGDALFELVFLAQISEESGHFSIADSIDTVCAKLIRRHPHVFGTEGPDASITTDQVNEQWARIKAQERADAGQEPERRTTTLTGVPRTLPSLLRAYKISARAAAVGFDWARPTDVVDKIEEEVAELRHEVESGATGDLSRAEDEMGDLLFAIANLSRTLGIEPEAALRRATDKFTRRFDAVEHAFSTRGLALRDATLAEMEDEWQRVKRST
ncbi:MAG: nucleoside triphosphate pyrophosphohydrolase [Acidobacteria bacterium]|nr:nucleoside triphosphate pyrophosphohydrolase [Acidobacteriota bacterium]